LKPAARVRVEPVKEATMLQTVLLVVHVLIAIALISIILLQQGRGATAGAAFGSGASATVFGARGTGTFLSRTTSILAILFFGNCMLLAYLASRQDAHPVSIGQQIVEPAAPVVAPGPAVAPPSAKVNPPTTNSDAPPIPASKP
jgi:preprotein translocase subunit SecG